MSKYTELVDNVSAKGRAIALNVLTRFLRVIKEEFQKDVYLAMEEGESKSEISQLKKRHKELASGLKRGIHGLKKHNAKQVLDAYDAMFDSDLNYQDVQAFLRIFEKHRDKAAGVPSLKSLISNQRDLTARAGLIYQGKDIVRERKATLALYQDVEKLLKQRNFKRIATLSLKFMRKFGTDSLNPLYATFDKKLRNTIKQYLNK